MLTNDDVTLSQTIGCNIKKLREATLNSQGKPLSQSECAKKIGASQQQWAAWEAGKNVPGDVYLSGIAKLFGIVKKSLWFENTPPAAASGDIDQDLAIKCLIVQELLSRAARHFSGDASAKQDREALIACSKHIQELAKILEIAANKDGDSHQIA